MSVLTIDEHAVDAAICRVCDLLPYAARLFAPNCQKVEANEHRAALAIIDDECGYHQRLAMPFCGHISA